MTRISCDVMGDLMPLVLDGMACKDTEMLMHEHLAACKDCRERYAEMQRERREEALPPPAPLLAVKRELRRRRLDVALAAACLVAFVVVLAFGWLTKPQYGAAQGAAVVTGEDGMRYVHLENDAICYRTDVLENPDLGGKDMIVYAWITPWDRLLCRGGNGTTEVMLPKDAARVYYADLASDGGLMLLDGEEPNGGGMMLPRLAARAYLLAALAGAAVFIVGTVLLIQRSRLWRFTALAAVFCLSFAVVTAMIIGPSLRTYTLARDMLLIVPCALFMTGALAFGNRVRHQTLKDKGLRSD